jgi:ribonucleoside-diphosphate reductase alpha chain
MDCIGTLTSLALQYGVPLEALLRKFAHQRFEPSGFTKNPEIRNASSIIDYVFRWLSLQFVPGYREANLAGRNQTELSLPGLIDEAKKKINRPVPDLPLSDDTDILLQPARLPATNGNGNGNGGHAHAASAATSGVVTSLSHSVAHFQLDAPTCPNCGHVAVRNGACYKCLNCGESLGCS